MNNLTTVLSILIFLGFIVGGYLLSQHIFSIFDGGEGLFILLVMVCASIWFNRHDKDGLYRLFKDIHQSNLNDIEQQQLEEPLDEVIVKEQISNSAAAFWFFLFLLICCVSFLMFQESIGLIDWLIALIIIAAPLILAYFVGEWFVDKDDIEIQELEEQEVEVI